MNSISLKVKTVEKLKSVFSHYSQLKENWHVFHLLIFKICICLKQNCQLRALSTNQGRTLLFSTNPKPNLNESRGLCNLRFPRFSLIASRFDWLTSENNSRNVHTGCTKALFFVKINISRNFSHYSKHTLRITIFY